jgi:hypothetical protein
MAFSCEEDVFIPSRCFDCESHFFLYLTQIRIDDINRRTCELQLFFVEGLCTERGEIEFIETLVTYFACLCLKGVGRGLGEVVQCSTIQVVTPMERRDALLR